MAQTGNHKGLTFGIFLAPFHRVGENPTLGMARDMELIEWIDELGFDEAWIGEHHSAGWETIASPEVFIGAAIERTRYIRLGSGVTSLPYHHPLMVANRFVQLDHMSRGRTMLGCGPGALPSDMGGCALDALACSRSSGMARIPNNRNGMCLNWFGNSGSIILAALRQ